MKRKKRTFHLFSRKRKAIARIVAKYVALNRFFVGPALEGGGATNNNERNGGAGEMKKYDGGGRFLRDVDDPQWDEHKLCALHIMLTVLTMLTPLKNVTSLTKQ